MSIALNKKIKFFISMLFVSFLTGLELILAAYTFDIIAGTSLCSLSLFFWIMTFCMTLNPVIIVTIKIILTY